MAGFHFSLAPLQKYREHQRDLCRQVLAQVLADDAALVQRREQLIAAREQLLAEMLELQGHERLNVDQSAARRYHAAQLLAQVRQVDAQREQVAEQLLLCRQTLAKADQGVKVLEQLAEKQKLEYLQKLDAKESREREEVWQSGKIVRQSRQ